MRVTPVILPLSSVPAFEAKVAASISAQLIRLMRFASWTIKPIKISLNSAMMTRGLIAASLGSFICIHLAKFITGITTPRKSKIPSIYSGTPGSSVKFGILMISRTFATLTPYIPSYTLSPDCLKIRKSTSSISFEPVFSSPLLSILNLYALSSKLDIWNVFYYKIALLACKRRHVYIFLRTKLKNIALMIVPLDDDIGLTNTVIPIYFSFG